MSKKLLTLSLTLCLVFSLSVSAFASSFTDAHGNVIELDDTLEAYNNSTALLCGADNAARKHETNLGDLWTDALRWFATSGKINEYFEADDVTAGNTSVAVDADHVVALWNGGNLRDNIGVGTFGADALAKVLPYPNKVAIVYMTGAQLIEALEAASQGLPYADATADACASFMQVSGLKYTVDIGKTYDAGEAYGKNWFKANSLGRVTISEVNGKAFDAAATYAVITSNPNFNGMDSSYIFKDAAAANEKSTITTAVVRDIVFMYIDEVLENVVGSDYASSQGRITLLHGNFTLNNEYKGFDDVDESAWYGEQKEGIIRTAAQLGIVDGYGNGKFGPNDELKVSEAVKIAAVLHSIQAGDHFVFTQGEPWYQVYVDYAIAQDIIKAGDFTNDTAVCTRAEAAYIFSRALPAGELTAIRTLTPPDVAKTDKYGAEIYQLYAAGVLRGNDAAGTFGGNGAFSRAQAAAFIARLALPALRK